MRLGVMQGRLCPPVDGRIQAFPGDCWPDEFGACRALGLECIEWIFERRDVELNPLLTDAGVDAIKRASSEHGVAVGSVVADYFMEERLFGDDASRVADAVATLVRLLERCREAGIPLVELPFVDSSALSTEKDIEDATRNLRGPLERAGELGVRVSLETSLPPKRFRELLDALRPFRVGANFDMGNSASLGYAPAEEIPALGRDIVNVHIKDRVRGGSTVPLGRGDTDFATVFEQLAAIGYRGDFIFQAARQDPKAPEATLREYLDFVRPLMAGLS